MRSQRGFVLACALTGTLALAGSAAADTDIQGNPNGLPDLDVRAGKLAPTAAQRTDVRDLGAQVAWNQFGTPVLARAARRRARRGRPGLERRRRRARLAVEQPLALPPELDRAAWRWSATTRWPAAPPTPSPCARRSAASPPSGGGPRHRRRAPRPAAPGRSSRPRRRSTATGRWTARPACATARPGRRPPPASAASSRWRRSRACAARAASARGWKGLRVAGLGDVQQARQVAFPTVSHGFVPAYETLVLDTQAAEPDRLPRVRRRAQRRGPRAREPRRQRERRRPPRAPADRRSSPAACRPRTAAATPRRARSPSPRATACARSTCSPTPTRRLNDIVLQAVPRRRPRSPRPTRSARPSASATRPTAACPPATTSSRCASSATASRRSSRAPTRARSRSTRARRRRRTPRAGARSRPTRRCNPLPADPWNNPSTDTRENMCWKQSTTPSDCDKVVGNLASRSPWDFRPASRTRRPSRRAATTRARPSRGRTPASPGPTGSSRSSPTRNYTFPWTNEWFTADCNPGTPYGANSGVGKSFDVSAAAANLFAMHNRMHDFSYLLGFTEENWNSQ